MNRSRIGTVTEINDPFRLNLLNKVISKINGSANIPIALDHHQSSFADVIKTISSSNAYIIILNVSPFLVLPMFREADKNKLTWPNYAWILHSYQFSDIPGKFKNQFFLKRMFVFQLIQEELMFKSETDISTDRGQSTLTPTFSMMQYGN